MASDTPGTFPYQSYESVVFARQHPESSYIAYHVLERTQRFTDGKYPLREGFQPSGIYAVLLPTRDYVGESYIDCEPDRHSGDVRKAKFAQYHSIVKAAPGRPGDKPGVWIAGAIRNWYSHRRYLLGCTACVNFTSKLCKRCGCRIMCKPISTEAHLKNTIEYLRRKRHISRIGPGVDPTPAEGEGPFLTEEECERLETEAELARSVRQEQVDEPGTTPPSGERPGRFEQWRWNTPAAVQRRAIILGQPQSKRSLQSPGDGVGSSSQASNTNSVVQRSAQGQNTAGFGSMPGNAPFVQRNL